jgi:hypothetical protein
VQFVSFSLHNGAVNHSVRYLIGAGHHTLVGMNL